MSTANQTLTGNSGITAAHRAKRNQFNRCTAKMTPSRHPTDLFSCWCDIRVRSQLLAWFLAGVSIRWQNISVLSQVSPRTSERQGCDEGANQTPTMSPLLPCQPWLSPSRAGHTLNINLIGLGRALLTYAKHQTDMSLFPQSPCTLTIKDNNTGSNLL